MVNFDSMQDATSDAVATVARAFNAAEAGDWVTVVDLTAPDVVDRYRAREIAHLLAWAEYMATRDKTGANGYSSNDVIKPELLQQYGHVRIERMPGTQAIGDLAAAPPKTFMADWLRLAHGTNPRLPVGHDPMPRQVIGALVEGTEVAHVVYRGMGWIPIVRVQIASLRLVGGRWLLLDNRDVFRSPDFWRGDRAVPRPSPAT